MSYTEREPRRAVELVIEMKDFSFIKTAEESSLNLSQGGAFIQMDDPYPSGTLVKFKLKTPEDGIIDGVGKVAWFRKPNGDPSVPGGVGIKFLKMSDAARAVLEKILEHADIIMPEPKDLPSTQEAAAPKKTSKTPEAKTSKAPDAKISDAPEARKSDAPETGAYKASETQTYKAPEAKISTAPETRKSEPPSDPKETEAKSEEPVSATPNTDRAYNAKKTETISFPPKGFPLPDPTEEAAEPSVAAEAVEPAEPSAETEESTQEAPAAASEASADQSSAASTEPSASTAQKEIAAPKSGGGTKIVVAAIIVIAIAGGAWAIFGMGGGAGADSPEVDPSPDMPAAPAAQADKAPVPPPPAADAPSADAPPADAPPATPLQAAPADEAPAAAADAPADEAAASEPAAAEPAPAPATGEMTTVEVIVTPPEAILTVNGTEQDGTSPFQVQLPKTGESTLSARAAGFLTQTIPFTPSEEPLSAAINLVPARIKFQVTSTPPGARILIDGKFNGTTPYTFLRKKYKPDYHWKIEKKGFESIEGTVAEDQWVEEGRYYIFNLDVELTRKKPEADTETQTP